MAVLTLKGIYEDGEIKLEEQPVGIVRAQVRVTFLPEPETGEETESREAARQHALARMEVGISFGGEKFNREDIYEERMRELEARQDRGR